MAEYTCNDCDVELEKHDNCGDWFGYTQDVGFVCPSCGTQYEKPEHGSFRKRDKKHICLFGSKKLKINHANNWDVQVPNDVGETFEYENEIFRKTKRRNRKGHFKYQLDYSPYRIPLKLTDKEKLYIDRRVIEKTPLEFFSYVSPHSDVEFENDYLYELTGDQKIKVVDLWEINHMFKYGEVSS